MDVSSLITQIKEMTDTVLFQVILGVIALSAAVYLYFIPSAIAYARRHKYTKTVFLLNLLFAWTGLGWILLVIWSFAGKKRQDNKKRQAAETEDIVQKRLKELT